MARKPKIVDIVEPVKDVVTVLLEDIGDAISLCADSRLTGFNIERDLADGINGRKLVVHVSAHFVETYDDPA